MKVVIWTSLAAKVTILSSWDVLMLTRMLWSKAPVQRILFYAFYIEQNMSRTQCRILVAVGQYVTGTPMNTQNPAAPSLKQILALLSGDRAEPPTPREAFPGTSQATGGSLQALIERNGVAKMEWVPRRPLGRRLPPKVNIPQDEVGGHRLCST